MNTETGFYCGSQLRIVFLRYTVTAANMAAVFGHMNYWNASGKMLVSKLKEVMREESETQMTIMGISYLFLSITAVLGNTVVITAVWRDPLKTLRSSPTNFMLLSLAIVDLMVGLVLAPGTFVFYFSLAMKEDPWTSLLPVFIFSHFFLIVSVGHILLLTIDRYFALAKPVKYRLIVTKKRVAIASSSIWVFCCPFAVLTSLLQKHFLVLHFIYTIVVWLSSESFGLVNFVTLKQLYKHHKTRIMNENSQSNKALLYEREKKVFVVILSVILAFYFCFLPWLVYQFLFFFCSQACHSNNRPWMVFNHAAHFIVFFNSAMNPLLYAWRFSKFQATFKYFWRKYCCAKGLRRNVIDVTDERQTYDTRL